MIIMTTIQRPSEALPCWSSEHFTGSLRRTNTRKKKKKHGQKAMKVTLKYEANLTCMKKTAFVQL